LAAGISAGMLTRHSHTKIFSGDRVGLLFIAPALIVFFVVLSFPIGYAGYLSLFKVKPDFTLVYNGLANFSKILKDPYFWNALENTIIYTFGSVALHVIIGFSLALALNSPWLKGRLFFRIAFFIPWSISFVVTAVTWRWVLNAQYGILNAFLRQAGIITENISFLGSAEIALPTAIMVNAWRGYPFVMVMIYAGLQAIPKEPYEAAMVDGASGTQLFWYITLPSLRGVILVASVLDMIWVFIQFELIQVLTAGGPGRSTELLTNLIYRESFSFYEFGIGSAIAMLTLLIVLGFSLIYVKLLGREQ
jgi:multiple sugar transport system permease protein